MQPKDRRLVTEQNLEEQLAPVNAIAQQADTTSNQALSSAALANQKSDTTVTRVEHIETLAGLAPGEVTDAQTANLVEQPDTQTRQSLNVLLDGKADREEIEQLSETDYVNMLQTMSYYDEISLVKTSDDETQTFDVYLRNAEITQKVTFVRPDDYFKMSGIRLISTAHLETSRDASVEDLTYQGLWQLYPGSPGYPRYARTVGASAEYNFTTSVASNVTLNHYASNVGGVFRVTLNDSDPVEVSTYAETAGYKSVELYTSLPAGSYTIRFEYLGSDPDNPPVSGDARGWISAASGSVELGQFLLIGSVDLPDAVNELVMSDTSNKEFAFSIGEVGSPSNEWVPQHGVRTGFERTEPIFMINGVPHKFSDFTVGQEYPCQNFKLIQDIYGRNPGSGDKNLINVKTIHSITRDGNINISGSMNVLADIRIGSSYVLMAPAHNRVFDTLQTGWGNRYATTKTDASRTSLPEGIGCGNYIYLSSYSDFYVAFRHTDKRGNFNLSGQAEKRYDNFIDHRSELIVKHYINIFDFQDLPAGYKYRWSGDYLAGHLKGVHDLMSS